MLVLVVPVGNVLLLLVQSSGLSEAISIYMVIAILGIELVVALPCLLIYTGNQVPKTVKNMHFYLQDEASTSQPIVSRRNPAFLYLQKSSHLSTIGC